MLLTRKFLTSTRSPLLLRNYFAAGKSASLTHDQHHKSVDHHEEDHHDHDDHGHGHHHKPYDWRDDYQKNLDFQQNVIHRGTPDPRQYDFPYHGNSTLQWVYSHPSNYNQKNLTQVLTSVKTIDKLHNQLRAPVGDIQADIAHQYDYESQDVDFQPESFKTQHFRKKGKLIIWILVGFLPYIFVISQFFVQKFPDEYHWRLQRPPPLEYPDPQDTPDRKDAELFESAAYKYLQEAGIVGDPFFTIEGKKKIYTKQSGVNQPMDEI